MNGDHQQTALTPANTAEVQQLLKRVTEGAVAAEESLQKLGKAAILAMAESLIQSVTNSELVELNRRKKKKTQRTKGNYGVARFMNQAVLDERTENKRAKEWKEVIRELMRLGPDILNSKPRRRRRTTMLPSDSTAIVRASPVKKNVQLRNTATASSGSTKRSMMVTLHVKVTSKELEQGLQSKRRQQDQQKQQGQQQKQGQQEHVDRTTDQLGRGMRIRKPSTRCM